MTLTMRKPDTSSRFRDRASFSKTSTVEDEWIKASQVHEVAATFEQRFESSDALKQATHAPLTLEKKSSLVVKKNPPIRMSDRKVQLLQQWECVVLNVNSETVECEMHDLTNESLAVEFAEIYLDEFHRFDQPRLEEGAVFYWSIGRETSATGQVRRYSELRLRRMPELSKQQKKEISRRAENLSNILKQYSE